jgi:hypothetical protein
MKTTKIWRRMKMNELCVKEPKKKPQLLITTQDLQETSHLAQSTLSRVIQMAERLGIEPPPQEIKDPEACGPYGHAKALDYWTKDTRNTISEINSYLDQIESLV